MSGHSVKCVRRRFRSGGQVRGAGCPGEHLPHDPCLVSAFTRTTMAALVGALHTDVQRAQRSRGAASCQSYIVLLLIFELVGTERPQGSRTSCTTLRRTDTALVTCYECTKLSACQRCCIEALITSRPTTSVRVCPRQTLAA